METNLLSGPPEPTPVEFLVQTANDVIGKKSRFIQNLLREDVLNLTLVPIDPLLGDREIRDYAARVRIYGQEVQPQIARIPAVAIENLFLDAGSMYAKGDHYVSGLRMFFGLDAAAAGIPCLFPVYCPLFMKRTAQNIEAGTGLYDPEEGPRFVFSEGRFWPVNNEETEAYIQHYKNEVRIKHDGETEFTAFRPGHDVESLVFPFQTVFTLMADNASDEVYLYNAIRPHNNGADGVWQCILLLPQESDVFFGDSNQMKGKYANRSKLCPPDCSVLLYEVEIFR